MLFFKGRWWETLVAHKVRTWSQRDPNRPEVWQSVLFQTENNSSRTKNEVDVLLNNQQKLIFIECKSGNVTQNDIYKVDAVRETYGGDISLAVLASYYPVEDSLQEKARICRSICSPLPISTTASIIWIPFPTGWRNYPTPCSYKKMKPLYLLRRSGLYQSISFC